MRLDSVGQSVNCQCILQTTHTRHPSCAYDTSHPKQCQNLFDELGWGSAWIWMGVVSSQWDCQHPMSSKIHMIGMNSWGEFFICWDALKFQIH